MHDLRAFFREDDVLLAMIDFVFGDCDEIALGELRHDDRHERLLDAHLMGYFGDGHRLLAVIEESEDYPFDRLQLEGAQRRGKSVLGDAMKLALEQGDFRRFEVEMFLMHWAPV